MGDEEGEVAVNPATGDVYEGGRNEEGERHGEGVAKYANGDVYKVRCGPALTDAATRRTACRRLRRRRRLLRHTGLLATSCLRGTLSLRSSVFRRSNPSLSLTRASWLLHGDREAMRKEPGTAPGSTSSVGRKTPRRRTTVCTRTTRRAGRAPWFTRMAPRCDAILAT